MLHSKRVKVRGLVPCMCRLHMRCQVHLLVLDSTLFHVQDLGTRLLTTSRTPLLRRLKQPQVISTLSPLRYRRVRAVIWGRTKVSQCREASHLGRAA